MSRHATPRVVYFGMDSEFSTRPLMALLESGVTVRAVVKPVGGVGLRRTNFATRVPSLVTRFKEGCAGLLRPGPAAGTSQPARSTDDTVPEDPFVVADAARIPCIVVGDASGSRSLRILKRLEADVYCIAFFNQLLRRTCLALPRLGAMNLHPSLLPAYRGPSPLFWTFKDALPQTGLTLHLLSPGEDDGDILEQEVVPVTDGMRGTELLAGMARLGARMMTRAVWDVTQGRAQPRPQDHARATRHARPTAEDLRVDFSRPARSVFNFVRGVCHWMPLHAVVGQERLDVLDALAFEPGARVPGETALSGDTLLATCADGTVVLRVRAT